MALLRADPHAFIVFCDDLSFDGGDASYKSLKAALEGGVEGRPANVLFYATSNRRHLLPRDMMENERSTRDQSRRGGRGEGLALRPLRPLARFPQVQPGRISRQWCAATADHFGLDAPRGGDRARRARMGDDARLALGAHGLAVHAGSRRPARRADGDMSAPSAPKAPKRPHEVSAQGRTWSDDYAWLRAENWREVLRDPAALPPDIRVWLEAENAYCDAMLAPLAGLRKQLVREMRARMKEDDSEPCRPAWAVELLHALPSRRPAPHPLPPPARRRARDGAARRRRARGRGGFFQLGHARHAPDHALFAWSADASGSEMYEIRVRDIAAGADLPDVIANTTGDFLWTRDGRALLYMLQDQDHRPFRILLHRLGTPREADALIFEEPDPAWFLSLPRRGSPGAPSSTSTATSRRSSMSSISTRRLRRRGSSPRARLGSALRALRPRRPVLHQEQRGARKTSRLSPRRSTRRSRRTGARSCLQSRGG